MFHASVRARSSGFGIAADRSDPVHHAESIRQPMTRSASASIRSPRSQTSASESAAPIGYAAFAFALGVTAGVLIRRAIPAMAVTLAAFVVVQGVVSLSVRPHLMSPASATIALDAASIDGFSINGTQLTVNGRTHLPGALVVSTSTPDATGKPFDGTVPGICLDPKSSSEACTNAVAALHLPQVVDPQPSDRYWTFQWIETGIYAALALVATGLCLASVKRRAGR